MPNGNNEQQIDFTVDKKNLYREESITDIKVASIRRLIPINPDGSDDQSRTAIYIGHTQLMSPEGPIPIQAKIPANNLEEAMDAFPEAMQQALAEIIESIQKAQREQELQGGGDSRIIVPGR